VLVGRGGFLDHDSELLQDPCELGREAGVRQLSDDATAESTSPPHEKANSSAQADAPKHRERVDGSVLGDDRAPRCHDGPGRLRSVGIPAYDNGKGGSLAALGAGSDVRARNWGDSGTMAQTRHGECKATAA